MTGTSNNTKSNVTVFPPRTSVVILPPRIHLPTLRGFSMALNTLVDVFVSATTSRAGASSLFRLRSGSNNLSDQVDGRN